MIVKEKTEPFLGRLDPEIYSQARPSAAEVTAIEKVLAWSKHLHICHLSTSAGIGAGNAGERGWEKWEKYRQKSEL